MKRALNKLTACGSEGRWPPAKYSDGGGLWFHKRPDGGAAMVPADTCSRTAARNGVGSLSRCVVERSPRTRPTSIGAMVRQGIGRHQGTGTPERREDERNMHILRDIAEDAFESRKAELKGDGTAGRWFSPAGTSRFAQAGQGACRCKWTRATFAIRWPRSGTPRPDTAQKAMNRLSICFRHAAALGLDVDLQATEKAKALLGKQRHKVQNIPALALAGRAELLSSA